MTIGRDTHLGFVFVPFAQARGLQHADQHHLTPVALGFIVAFQRPRQIDRFLRHLRVQLLKIANFMRQGMTLARLLAEAFLHLTAKTIELLAQRREQAVQTLPVLFIHAAVALLEDTVGKVFKLLAQSLLAVKHQAIFFIAVLAGGFQQRGHLAQVDL